MCIDERINAVIKAMDLITDEMNEISKEHDELESNYKAANELIRDAVDKHIGYTIKHSCAYQRALDGQE